MTRKPLLSITASLCLALAIVLTILAGCRPTCDSVPTEALGSVRIVNAVSNSTLLLVYIDGKLFDSCWYDIDNKYAKANPTHIFGYRTTYLSDGSGLRAGLHHVAGMDANTRDTVATWDGVLHEYRQTLIFPGKMNGSALQTPQDKQNPDRRVRYLNDNTRNPEARSFARFVEAVPDIGGTSAQGLDVYFSNTPTIVAGQPHPDLRIRFDSISHNDGLDNGSGLDSNDYLEFPAQVPGLLIMPVNDTMTGDAILNFPHTLPTSSFLATILVRGEINPIGTEPIASVLVLEDAQQSPGNFAFDILSTGARIVNATNYDSISLLISSSNDQTVGFPRGGIAPFPGQEKVINIIQDSVSEYMPLGTFASFYDFWFAHSPSPGDTVFRFTTELDAAASGLRIPLVESNVRYTFIAIDTIPNDAGNSGVNLLELVDTVASPTNTGKGRVRFVNTTADYTAKFTFAGKPYSMAPRNITYADTTVNTYSIQVTGAGTPVTITIPVQNATPTTVFFMPSVAGNPIPYRITTQ
jgi:hypothetical protein